MSGKGTMKWPTTKSVDSSVQCSLRYMYQVVSSGIWLYQIRKYWL